MKKGIEIRINGETYPCRMTMGAMLRFKEATGHEVTDFDGGVQDICAFVWAIVASAARREGKRFDMTFWDFCDTVDPEELSRCWEGLQAEQADEAAEEAETSEEKKSQ